MICLKVFTNVYIGRRNEVYELYGRDGQGAIYSSKFCGICFGRMSPKNILNKPSFLTIFLNTQSFARIFTSFGKQVLHTILNMIKNSLKTY